MKVLITGASGFVGQATTTRLQHAGHSVTPIERRHIGDIGSNVDWTPHIENVDAIIHLAARVHVMNDSADDPLSVFRKVNVESTVRLAAAARNHGVRRFIYASSIKVNGDQSSTQLTPNDAAAPQDPYAISKWEAELALSEMKSDMDIVIMRPPLVYGPGVKGNFRRLIDLLERGTPLPLASVKNKRSFISLCNFADALYWSLEAPSGLYLPSDRDDKSTPELIQSISSALHKPARLFPCPPEILRFAGKLLRKSDTIDRLVESLRVDGDLPGWEPPQSFEAGIKQTIEWYRSL